MSGQGHHRGYLPLAATLATDDVYQAFLGEYEEFKTFFHGHTYSGNPLGAAVGLASLDIFAQDRVIEGLAAKIELLAGRLATMAEHPHVGDIRQRGLMVGIELVADKGTREPFPLKRRTGHRVILAARQLGAILRPLGDVIVLLPPLCHHPGRAGHPVRYYRSGHRPGHRIGKVIFLFWLVAPDYFIIGPVKRLRRKRTVSSTGNGRCR